MGLLVGLFSSLEPAAHAQARRTVPSAPRIGAADTLSDLIPNPPASIGRPSRRGGRVGSIDEAGDATLPPILLPEPSKPAPAPPVVFPSSANSTSLPPAVMPAPQIGFSGSAGGAEVSVPTQDVNGCGGAGIPAKVRADGAASVLRTRPMMGDDARSGRLVIAGADVKILCSKPFYSKLPGGNGRFFWKVQVDGKEYYLEKSRLEPGSSTPEVQTAQDQLIGAPANRPVESPAVVSEDSETVAGSGCNDGSCVEGGGTTAPNPIVSMSGRFARDVRNVATNDMAFSELRGKGWSTVSSRGLVQLPTWGDRGAISFCGTRHYNAKGATTRKDFDANKKPIDNYANPLTACSMMAIAQEWKDTKCKSSDSGCKIAWGDIAHKTLTSPKWDHSNKHDVGNCVDIRPMQKGDFVDRNVRYGYSYYDRAKTREFIEFVKSKGASVIFNDPAIRGVSRARGHDNHLHVCFPNSRTVRATCENFKYNPSICEGGT